MRINERAFTAIETIFVIFAILLIAGLGVFVYTQNVNAPTNEQEQTQEHDEQNTTCREQEGIELCISVADKKVDYLDETTVKLVAKNTSDEVFTYTFSSTCTGPVVYINDESVNSVQVCGQALTDVEIAPNKAIDYDYTVSGSDLVAGENIVHMSWFGIDSPNVTIVLDEESISEVPENLCIDGEEHHTCKLITVYLEDDAVKEEPTCETHAIYFEELDISYAQQPCEEYVHSVASGVIFFYVPPNDVETWEARIEQIEEVDFVASDL